MIFDANKNKFLSFALPLAVLSFALVTARAELACDGASETRFGFPLFRIAPDLALSLAQNVDLAAPAIDFAVYLGVWSLVLRWIFFEHLSGSTARRISIYLWAAAFAVAAIYVFYLLRLAYLSNLTWRQSRCSTIKWYAPYFGFPFLN